MPNNARVLVFVTFAALGCGSPESRAGGAQPPIDTGHVAIDSGALFYEVSGSGPVVVLLHGGNLDRRMWDDQFRLFSRTYRVIRYDARGYGRSSPADHPFAAHDDLHALLRGLHIERASLIGLSMGGRIAMDFTLAHPAMVDRLVLAAPGISGGKWADDGDTAWLAPAREAAARKDSVGLAVAWLGSAYIRTAMEKPALAPRLRQISIDNAGYWMGVVRHGDLEREASPPAADRLEALGPAVLLLVGDRDTPFIADIARAIAARAPRVRRVDIPKAGHMLNVEAPERFNDEVLRFLASGCPPKIACQ
jgi:3-oxoadipate enol-lactonase